MPLERKTLSELQEIHEASLAQQFGITTPLLRNTVVKTFAFVWAAAEHILYGFIDNRSKQIFPDTATTVYLDRWAAIWGVTRKDASFAAGNVVFTGIDSTLIPAGTEITRADNQKYTTDGDDTISGGSATIAVTASEAGTLANTEEGSTLTLSSPIAGVDPAATVDSSGLSGGADIETDDDLRGRLIARIQSPPQGGSEADYERWTLEVSGITRAFVFPDYLGAGNVGISFVLDNDPVSIIPGAAKIQEVEDYLESRRSVTHNVLVFAPVPVELDIDMLLKPNTAGVQATVTAELEDLLRREGGPGVTILLSQIDEAISIAEGEEDHELLEPRTNVPHEPAEIPVIGDVTFDDL